MSRSLPVLVLMLVLCVAGAARAELSDPLERLHFADGLYARGMHELAIREYRAFLELFPANTNADVATFRLGECYRALDDFMAAERQFRQVFTKYTNSAFRLRAGFRRADLFLDAGRYAEAIDLFGVVLKEDLPEDIAAASLYFLGEAQLRDGRTNEATAAFMRVKDQYALNEFASYALLKMGGINADMADRAPGTDGDTGRAEAVKRAIALYEEVAARPASDRAAAEALFQKAELYFRQREYDKSAAAYGKLLDSYPTDPRCTEARLQAAWAHHNAGLYAEALRVAIEALANPAAMRGEGQGARRDRVLKAMLTRSSTSDPTAEWLYIKANCERQLVKYADAIATYDQLIGEFPRDNFAKAGRYEKALTLFKKGEFQAAIDEAQAIDLTPENRKDVYWLLAESYSSLEMHDDAVQYYRLITREFPESSMACDATYRLGHRLQLQGDFKEAARYYNALVEHHPDSALVPKALFASGFCYLKEDMHAEAARDWSRLIKGYPDEALVEDALCQKAMCEVRLGRKDEALTSLRLLLSKFPKTTFQVDARYWVGRLLAESGSAEDAESEFRQVLKLGGRKELQREATLHLAVVLKGKGDLAEAADLFESLLASPVRDQLSPDLLEWLSELRFAEKEFVKAVAAAELLVEFHKEPRWQQTGWGLVGRGTFALGDMDKARAASMASLAADAATPFAAESALRLGEILTSDGTHDAAAKQFKRAAALASGERQLGIRARAYVGLGRAMKELGDFDGAARYFMSVAILFDDDDIVPECLFDASLAFARSGRDKERLEALRELVKRYPESTWAKRPEVLEAIAAPGTMDPASGAGGNP